ncbi:MAG: PTS sugar transporter subunit IIC [Erysipelotrichaceae bacterium]
MQFSEKFQDTLMLIAEKVDDNQYLQAIKNAFTTFMPFVIVGSFGTLLKTLICSTSFGLARLIPWCVNLSPAFSAINFCTLSIMTLPIVYLIASNLAKHDKQPEHVMGITALAAYIAVVPQVVNVVVEGVSGSAAGLAGTVVGAQGLFVGMFVAILCEKLMNALLKLDAIKIKMPASVPAAISQSFNVLIPTLITLVVFAVAGQLFTMVSGQYINEFIYTLIQAPLEAIIQSPAGIILLVVFSQLFWFLGIHGGLVVTPIRNPLLTAALAANTAALAAGATPDQPVTMGFWLVFIVIGGAGCILSLILAIFIASKREDYRMIAKLGLVPAICGISEPVVFGLPLVLNPTFAIPFIFNSGISTAIALFFTKIGFLPCNTVDAPFGVPVILNAIIGHGWQGAVVQVVILVVTTLVWIPFVLASNKQKD